MRNRVFTTTSIHGTLNAMKETQAQATATVVLVGGETLWQPEQTAGIGMALGVVLVAVAAYRLLCRDWAANREDRHERRWARRSALRRFEAESRSAARLSVEEEEKEEAAPASGKKKDAPLAALPSQMSYKDLRGMDAETRAKILAGVRGRRP